MQVLGSSSHVMSPIFAGSSKAKSQGLYFPRSWTAMPFEGIYITHLGIIWQNNEWKMHVLKAVTIVGGIHLKNTVE